ncbi:MAG: DUF1801 domain-containing protein [Gemmatimonadales bacterium]|nr:DUF1801 domain-containing protein [Gemmatimonadales bacterium]
MRACGDDVTELLHDGHPTACVGDAAFGYVNVFTAHVNVGFFHGADLDDPAHLLEGTGRRMARSQVLRHCFDAGVTAEAPLRDRGVSQTSGGVKVASVTGPSSAPRTG